MALSMKEECAWSSLEDLKFMAVHLRFGLGYDVRASTSI